MVAKVFWAVARAVVRARLGCSNPCKNEKVYSDTKRQSAYWSRFISVTVNHVRLVYGMLYSALVKSASFSLIYYWYYSHLILTAMYRDVSNLSLEYFTQQKLSIILFWVENPACLRNLSWKVLRFKLDFSHFCPQTLRCEPQGQTGERHTYDKMAHATLMKSTESSSQRHFTRKHLNSQWNLTFI